MREQETHIDTRDGRMDVFVAHPREDGAHSVVLFYMDAPGIREELRAMARQIAAQGYFVVLPNLYYRQVNAASPEFARLPDAQKIAFARHISNRLIMHDTEALLTFVDAHPLADAAAVGVLGYCMSGAFAICAAGSYPDRICCGASVYGTNLVTDRDDSPHRLAPRASGELYFACAEHDDYVPGEVIRTLEAHLATTATNYRLDWYPGTRHGFAFAEREGAYDAASAERLWNELFALFRRNLFPVR